jgi:hypothetical protein
MVDSQPGFARKNEKVEIFLCIYFEIQSTFLTLYFKALLSECYKKSTTAICWKSEGALRSSSTF